MQAVRLVQKVRPGVEAGQVEQRSEFVYADDGEKLAFKSRQDFYTSQYGANTDSTRKGGKHEHSEEQQIEQRKQWY